MRRRLPIRDEIAAYQREAVAERRVGEGAQCACGESRPEALIAESAPIRCIECNRKLLGQATVDDHHPAGKANSPITTPVPANDHCAELTVAQQDWPKKTLENPDGSPLLAAAASIRGYSNTNSYQVRTLLLTNPEMLEELDSFLTKERGPEWWVGTSLEKYVPKR